MTSIYVIHCKASPCCVVLSHAGVPTCAVDQGRRNRHTCKVGITVKWVCSSFLAGLLTSAGREIPSFPPTVVIVVVDRSACPGSDWLTVTVTTICQIVIAVLAASLLMHLNLHQLYSSLVMHRPLINIKTVSESTVDAP